jgi:hypothetical protein
MGRPKGSKNRPKLPVSNGTPITFDPYHEPITTYAEPHQLSLGQQLVHPEIKYQIVEVDKPRPNIGWDKESRETVMTLAAHPGFICLLQKLSTQAALLKAKLVNDRHKEIKDVEFIQSGIFWCNWLQSQLTAATQRVKAEPQAAMDEEAKAFKELNATLIRVGED